jgi:hypothetical protein
VKRHAVATCVALFALTWVSFAFAEQAPSAGACPVTEPVRAHAPRDPNADPISGYWYVSTDQLLWAPAPTPGVLPTTIGRYWVRPQGTQLKFVARRLDKPEREAISTEREGYPTGFYFGSVDIPTDGCWEVTATAGTSQVTFVVEIRYPLERFVRQPATRLVWSKEIGRIEEGGSSLAVIVMHLEDPASVTRRARGIRIDLTNGLVSDQLWEEEARLSGTRPVLASWAAGRLPMVYGLGRTHNAIGNASGLSIAGKEHQYSFPGSHRPADLARLFLQALEELNTQAP